MKRPRLSLVAAVAKNGVIGRANQMPWRVPSDLRRFKALTLGHPVVMGRKTFQSVGRPLPGRDNIVVSRLGFHAEGVVTRSTLEAALAFAAEKAGEGGEIFVIGGAEIYRETLARADRLYITEIDAAPAGDAMFPHVDPAAWRVVERHEAGQAEGDSAASAFIIYERAGSIRG